METTKDFAVAVTTKIRKGDVVERMVTVRADTVEEAEELYRNLMTRMEMWGPEADQLPGEPYNGNGNGHQANPYCQEHRTPYKQYEKEGRSWWAHKAGSGWCHLKERVRG